MQRGWKNRGETNDVMGRAIELGLQVHDGERHAEKVDGVASPSQPTNTNKSRPRSELDKPLTRPKRHDSPREEETPLRQSNSPQDLQQRSRSVHFLPLREQVSHKVRGHQGGKVQRGRETRKGEEVGGAGPETLRAKSKRQFMPLSIHCCPSGSRVRPDPVSRGAGREGGD